MQKENKTQRRNDEPEHAHDRDPLAPERKIKRSDNGGQRVQ